MESPIHLPIPNVIAAAASPKITCRMPEYQTLLPVNNVIAAPIKNNPTALIATLSIMAYKPFVKMKGRTGIIAPMANRTNE